MKTLQTLKLICEYLGASREAGPGPQALGTAQPPSTTEGTEPLPPRLRAWLTSPWLRGLWWGALAAAILLFSGQTSKFIYIDF